MLEDVKQGQYWQFDATTASYSDVIVSVVVVGVIVPCTAHLFAFSAMLASLARSVALICSLARPLAHSGAHGKEFVNGVKVTISHSFNLLCNALLSCSLNPLCIGITQFQLTVHR